jgi:CheY-like chemotaxis protein
VDVSGSRANWAEEVDSSSQSRITKKSVDPASARAHVLIVEDNELVTGALRILFEETGRRVTVAHSVADAVAAGRADPPDLLLLDLSLPDGDGLEVARALLRAGIKPRATVALTGRDDPESIKRCEEFGCVELLVKPIASRELLQKADRWLDRRSATE